MLGVAQSNNFMADGELWAQELDRLRQEWDKPKLEFRNGKFYRGDVEVPPEIGNWEQINLLRRIEKEKNK